MYPEIYVPKLMNKINDRIYIGAYHAAVNLEFKNEHSITHILNCTCDTHDELKRFDIQQLNIHDGYEITHDDLKFAFEAIERALSSGGRILVHCHAGISRSTGIVAGYLMRSGFSWDEALEIVRRGRPQAFPHPNIERSIKDYYNQTINVSNTLLGESNE